MPTQLLKIMYLRRKNSKEDRNTLRGHPIGAIGLLRHPRTKYINIATVLHHSAHPHFIKSDIRRALITKVFKDPTIIYQQALSDTPDIRGFIPESVYGRITDKKKAQEIFRSIVEEACMEGELENINNNGLKTTIDKFGRISTVEEVELNEKIDKHILCEEACMEGELENINNNTVKDLNDLKALAIHEHKTRMAALQKSLTGCSEAP